MDAHPNRRMELGKGPLTPPVSIFERTICLAGGASFLARRNCPTSSSYYFVDRSKHTHVFSNNIHLHTKQAIPHMKKAEVNLDYIQSLHLKLRSKQTTTGAGTHTTSTKQYPSLLSTVMI